MSVLPSPTTLTVPALPESWHVLSFKVLAGSRLAIVGTDADLHAAWRSDRAKNTLGEYWRLAQRAKAKVWWVQGDQLFEGVQFALLEPFPIIEQFRDGRWLVANSRSDGQGNTRIFGADGSAGQHFELGDGIRHIKIDDQSRIWVGWFDEGVFGNDRWRLPGLKCAPSAHGVASFNDQGALLTHATLNSIADCYALNVFGTEAWACTYTHFPIWQMDNSGERNWRTELSGTRAIAVRPPYVLAAGGYQEERNRVVLLRLYERAAETVGEWCLPFEMASPVEVGLVDGRDDELHVVHRQEWHRWRVAEFVKACE